MNDLPRLVVDREQAERIAKVAILQGQRPDNTVTLAERPTVPWWNYRGFTTESKASGDDTPITPGTRVEVGWEGPKERLTYEGTDVFTGETIWRWHPVATATVADCIPQQYPEMAEPESWYVTLTDIEAVS